MAYAQMNKILFIIYGIYLIQIPGSVLNSLSLFHIHKLQYANDHFFLKCTCKIYGKHIHDIIFQSSICMQIFLILLALQNR